MCKMHILGEPSEMSSLSLEVVPLQNSAFEIPLVDPTVESELRDQITETL